MSTNRLSLELAREHMAVVFVVLVLSVVFAAGVDAKTQVTLWHQNRPEIRQLVKMFNERNPDIEVILETVATTGDLSKIADKVTAAIAAGTPPDVMQFNRPYASVWAAQDRLIPLDNYLAHLDIRRDQFIPFAWDEGTYDGKVYVLPEETDARGVFYNRHLLAQAGVDPDGIPENLDDFDLLARKLTKQGADGSYEQIGFIPWHHQGRYLFTWTPSFGGKLYDQTTGRITVNHPQNVRILEWMMSYADRFGYDALRGSLPVGTLAFSVDVNSRAKSLASQEGLDFGVAYLPAPENGVRRATYAGGYGIAIPVGAKHPEEAARFIAFWVSDEAQLFRAMAKGNFPATRGAARDPYFLEDPIQSVFVNMLPNAQARPNIPILGVLWDEIKATTNRVLRDGEVPKAVLDDVTTRMQALLDETRQ